ncbi:MAG TPA: ferritin-like domain-containing protein [Polyangiaceae bacterium]|nr:ferritin-like domain-containing protein [Polyangiaceae bacterium]
MLRIRTDVWKQSLLLGLGLGMTECGNADPGAGAGQRIPEALHCQGETALMGSPALRLCQNGLIHRPFAPDASAADPADGCSSDDDCADGALCIGLYEPALGTACTPSASMSEVLRFACQTPGDECASDQQCSDGSLCGFTGQPLHHPGLTNNCAAVGRPFLVAGAARTAVPCARGDWGGLVSRPASDLDAADLDAAARAALARHWQSAALFEHASIAAFARFTLQLLALGAPAELCAASQRAMLDETDHARRCFALAARYSGAPIGPGPLEIEGALGEESLATIARLTFLEGCIGETCAALQAAEAHARSTDAAVRDTLQTISADEWRHALLAWRFIAWALQHDAHGGVRAALLDELSRARQQHVLEAQAEPGEHASRERSLERHGVLRPEHRRGVERAAMASLIVPCLEQLLGAPVRPQRPSRALALEV